MKCAIQCVALIVNLFCAVHLTIEVLKGKRTFGPWECFILSAIALNSLE